ncbi:fasciclin domain-containing protein [Pigmentiphaga aceris]|uniref:Fasciclin domain-containing protein n=1 Tax=Pigmentiphaga aceris TaxID=1940612 RepID=A0A5C0B841_9BURK|nr:fasciclin domain-containing protein [Pigmentiphaga aceris]QEI08997.1 fasciclin domain-containing protein [Pigmentiphaga aceris]
MNRIWIAGVLLSAGCIAGAQAADVVDTAAATGQARTMVEAAQSVGLSDTLRKAGPYTVFAPTDEAWAQLPANTVEQLLADKALLAEVLKYHVVPGVLHADDLKQGNLKTVQGQTLAMVNGPQGWQIDGASVVKADVEADNGVVYLIDKVIFPK